MNRAARIEDADPAQLVRMLEDALRWLKEEWFESWLTDEAHRDLVLDLDVDDRQQVQCLGTPYLQGRLEEVADLVREMTRDLNACLGTPEMPLRGGQPPIGARWPTSLTSTNSRPAQRTGARHRGSCRLGDGAARPAVERDRRGGDHHPL